MHLLVPLEAPCCPISCPLPTPELVSAAGTDLAPVRGHSPTASLSASPKEQGQHPSLASRAPRHSLDQPLAGATSLAFPSTLRVGLFAGSCGGSSQVAPGAAFSVFCLFKCFIVAWSQRGGLRNRWAAPVSLPGTVPGWCSHPAVPSTGWPGVPAHAGAALAVGHPFTAGLWSLALPGPPPLCSVSLSVPTVRGSASRARAWCLPAPRLLEL